MPELPEVEVVRAGLEEWATGAEISAVEVYDARSLRRHEAGVEDFQNRLAGAVLGQPRRRGKYLWIPLVQGPQQRTVEPEALVVHLGMSGQMLVSEAGIPDQRHLRIRLRLKDTPEREHAELRFVDQRIFGGLYLDRLVPAEDAAEELLPTTVTHIGRDPLDPRFDIDKLYQVLKNKRTVIKRAMLDQSVVSGIGNIYADEALWRAKLHYDRPTEKLTRKQVGTLFHAVQDVMREALAQGGTSFDALYVNVNGESGYFDRSLEAYGQEGEYCGRCLDEGHETLIRRDKFMNRSSYYCPRCQPAPRRRRTR